MSLDFNDLKEISFNWRKPIGLVFLLITMGAIYGVCFNYLKQLDLYSIEKWIFVPIAVICLAIWLITTQRIYFRNRGWSFVIALGIIGLVSIYAFVIYPKIIQNSKFDFPLIKLWGSILIVLLTLVIVFVIEYRYCNKNNLLIVLFVNNKKNCVENKVRESIDIAINNIEKNFKDITIIVPSFGVFQKEEQCERYIKRPFTRADAYIKTEVVDGGEKEDISYEFYEFSSWINTKRLPEKINSATELHEVDRIQKYQQWNYLNVEQTNCRRKIKIAENIENTLLMYVGSIYSLTNKFDKALSFVQDLNSRLKDESPRFKEKAHQIMGMAYLFAAVKEEHENHNYTSATEHLDILCDTFPNIKDSIPYSQTMARICFLKGDIKSSKQHNKRYGELEGKMWGYELNCGFYAIYEGKTKEFVSRYKKLLKLYPEDNCNVLFAIEFLEHQRDNAKSEDYKNRLKYAIAFLYQYVNIQKAKRMVAHLKHNVEIEPLIDIIKQQKNTLPVTRKK